jgi:hypothetical protein
MKYAHTYTHVKGTVEISGENMFIWAIKKPNFWQKKSSFLYTARTLLFSIAQYTMQFLPKLHMSIQDMCMYSQNKFYVFKT